MTNKILVVAILQNGLESNFQILASLHGMSEAAAGEKGMVLDIQDVFSFSYILVNIFHF